MNAGRWSHCKIPVTSYSLVRIRFESLIRVLKEIKLLPLLVNLVWYLTM